MALVDGAYRAVAVPFPETKLPAAVKVFVAREEVSTVAWIEDQSLVAAGKTFMLSQADTLDPSVFFLVRFRDGSAVASSKAGAKLSGLDGIWAAIARQEPNFEPSTVTGILVRDSVNPHTIPCAVVASRSDQPVSWSAALLFASPAEQPTLKAVSEGRFLEPRRTESPVTRSA